jgi:hypothetical protein
MVSESLILAIILFYKIYNNDDNTSWWCIVIVCMYTSLRSAKSFFQCFVGSYVVAGVSVFPTAGASAAHSCDCAAGEGSIVLR